jgi:hypothetical protein
MAQRNSPRGSVLNGLAIGVATTDATAICDFCNARLGNGDDVFVLGGVRDGQKFASWAVCDDHDIEPEPEAAGSWVEAELSTALTNPNQLVVANAERLSG